MFGCDKKITLTEEELERRIEQRVLGEVFKKADEIFQKWKQKEIVEKEKHLRYLEGKCEALEHAIKYGKGE